MENTRKIKAAVIGVGLIGEQHAETYQEYPRSELVMVYAGALSAGAFASGVVLFGYEFDKGLGARGFVQTHAGIELPTDKSKAVNESFFRTAIGYTFAQERGIGRAWTPITEVIIAHPFGEATEVDVVPQMQVSLSKMQHVLFSAGVRVPVTEREGRHPQFLTYFVWDWFEGGLFEFWK